jgi:hypothetical protein
MRETGCVKMLEPRMRRLGAFLQLGALPVAFAILLSQNLTAPARAEPRGVIELFTSQGCSSCPKADKLAAELARDPSLIVMTLPIDYWDYLGWKDTLAKPRHSMRQRGYANTRGDREVYTPQVVVNGKTHVLGSDKAAIEHALTATREQNKTILSVPVQLALTGDKLTVTLPARASAGNNEVWLCAYSRAVPVEIGKGENRGRTVTYANVIRRWVKLGDWNGAARNFTVPSSEFKSEGVDAIAVLVQAGTIEHPGAMLGAAVASLQ